MKNEECEDILISYSEIMSGQEYNELRLAVGWNPITGRQADSGLQHTTFLCVARDNDRIVGMGRVLFDFGYTAYIGDVLVRPEYQGQGIGSRIVRRLMEQTMNEAANGERVMFILGAAKGKEAFYEKLGFEKRPNDMSGLGMTKWIKKREDV